MSQYRVISCGSNGNFQLGIYNDIDQDILTPVKFDINNKITSIVSVKPIKIVCGGNHSFILFENGELYSSGDNTNGQCGHPLSKSSIEVFTKVCEDNWISVSCGWEFSVLINNSEEVFVCGLGMKGELGLGPEVLKTELVKLDFKFPDRIVDIKSSINHTIARLANGRLYGWGNCRKGQLGDQPPISSNSRSKPRPVVWEPELLSFSISNFDKFGLGRDLTVFLNKEEVSMFGKNSESFKLENVIDLKTMWSSIHLLIDDDRSKRLTIKSIGNNSHGQLYPGSSYSIKDFEIGSEHGLILTHDNKVYAWGWGEHGNCGQKKEQTHPSNVEGQVTFDYLNLIYNDKYPVKFLSCGCATTWLVLEII